jgi:hypothetical protein
VVVEEVEEVEEMGEVEEIEEEVVEEREYIRLALRLLRCSVF